MSRRDLSGKKPSNGSNTANRRSNLRSKGKKWKEQLVQGVKEREISDALDRKLEDQRQMLRDKKTQLKNEAKQLDIELGFVDPSAAKTNNKVPEWKRQKNFLNAIFPPPVISRKYNGVMVYRNKLSMQEYWHRVITPEEWEANMELLDQMRAIYDKENPEQQGLDQETDDTPEQDSHAEEGEGEVEEEGEEEGEGSDGEEEGEQDEAAEESDDESAAADGAVNTPEQINAHTQDTITQADEAEEGSDAEGEEEGSGDEGSEEEEDLEGAESESESVDESGVAGLSIA